MGHGYFAYFSLLNFSPFFHKREKDSLTYWHPKITREKIPCSPPLHNLEDSVQAWGMRLFESLMGTLVRSHQTTRGQAEHTSHRADFSSSSIIKDSLKAHQWKSWKASCQRTTKIILIWGSLKSKIPSAQLHWRAPWLCCNSAKNKPVPAGRGSYMLYLLHMIQGVALSLLLL